MRRLRLAAFGVAVFVATSALCLIFITPGYEACRRAFGHDFLPFYVAGSLAREGRYADLYDLDVVAAREQAVARDAGLALGDAVGPWWNPPVYAWLFAPFSMLPFGAALLAWTGLNLAALAASLVLLGRIAPRHRGIIPVLVLASAPFLQAFTHAQNTPFSLLLVASIALAWRNGNDLAAGALVGLLLYKPQLAAVIGVVLVLSRGWRAGTGLAAVGAITVIATAATMPGALTDYLHRMPLNLHFMQIEHAYLWERHVTLKAFWRLLVQGRAAGETSALVYSLTAAAALPFAAAIAWTAWRQRRCSHPAALIASAIVVTPLLMPFYFDYDLLLLAVPAVLLVAEPERSSSGLQLLAWSALYLWLFVNPFVGSVTRANLAVPLLALVGAAALARALRRAEQWETANTPAEPPPLRGRLWLAGSGLALFLMTLVAAAPFLDKDAGGSTPFGHDFLPAYVAGRFVRKGEPQKMYDREAFREEQDRVVREADLQLDGRYVACLNPPQLGLLFAPLSAMPYRAAAATWLGINVALFAASMALLVRMLPVEHRGDWRTWALVPLLVTVSMPFLQAAGHQQNTFLSLLILTGVVTLWRRGRGFAAGAVLGLLSYKPQLAAAVAVVLVIDLGRRAALGIGITGVALLVLTVTLTPGALSAYVHQLPANVTSIQSQPGYAWGRQVTVLGFARLLGASALVARTAWLAAATFGLVALAARALAARRAEADRSSTRDRLIAATVVVTPLLIPYSLDYDLLLLSVPAVLLAGELLTPDRAWTPSERWAVRGWIGLYAWCYANPAVAGLTRVGLTVPLLAAVAGVMIRRIGPVDRSPSAAPAPADEPGPALKLAA